VRNLDEHTCATIPGSINIPLNSLRDNLHKLNKDTKYILYCATGLRSYIGFRILVQRGFKDVWSLSGGFKTWQFATLD
jgi:rhodanese-related sulfurtransferase